MDDEIMNNIAEEEQLRNALGLGYPEQEEKVSVLAFLKEIINRQENVKTGNLSPDELGEAKIPVRTNLDLANYCKFMDMHGFADVFNDDAQVLLASSLSRGGFLDQLAVTTNKNNTSALKNIGAPQKKKGGFFGGRKTEENNL